MMSTGGGNPPGRLADLRQHTVIIETSVLTRTLQSSVSMEGDSRRSFKLSYTEAIGGGYTNAGSEMTIIDAGAQCRRASNLAEARRDIRNTTLELVPMLSEIGH